MRNQPKRRAVTGFTLIEMMFVVIIIGILVGFILVVAMEGIHRAEERATQSLIVKLDAAVADRLESLLISSVDTTQGHRYMATTWVLDFLGNPVAVASPSRTQVLARYDQLKAEMPDVFYVVPSNVSNYDPNYPLNFAAMPYPPAGIPSYPAYANYILPIGSAAPNVAQGAPFNWGDGKTVILPSGSLAPDPGTGIYGASYAVAGGLYKNLGYSTLGYDGRDNNGNGLVDELLEGTTDPTTGSVDPVRQAKIAQNLANHQHNTARSEMLYALLVEGLSPLGSFLDRDEFTDREVQDTDDDGMPEFVDAWGKPLQFYRWPIHYTSINDTQKGYTTYSGVFEPRQQDPLDPNQLLISPAWWSVAYNLVPDPQFQSASQGPMSGFAFYFHVYFHSLLDMNAVAPQFGILWDRSATTARRAYYSRFLIASSGLDQNLGIGQLNLDYSTLEVNWGPNPPPPTPSAVPITVQNLIQIENAAAPLSPFRNASSPYLEPLTTPQSQAITNYFQSTLGADVGGDDITNHNVLTGGTGVH
jgi:prepilin-type N-terminal cleavage/methylation domain-containing protein